ncbi:MAG: rod shape-determining protein MreC [Gemmatimonadaceae bacterium]|nr:rod shape-determining protein MreC [Gemmatimonadaceae bacterium]
MARGVRGGSAYRGVRFDNGLLLACVACAIIALVMPRRFRDSVASALRGTVLAPLVGLESRASRVRAAIASRDELLATRGQAATEALSLRAIVDENTVMRRLMGLSARLADGFVVADVLPRRGVDDDFTLTLNVGSNAGIAAFAPVVTADGLVGMVERVDANTAFAITWADPSFRVSAMSVDNRAFGIVQPHLGSGAERLMLELKGVPFRDKLDSGAVIVSSGLGTTYPRGIPVGIVMGEISTPEKWARTYLLMPAVLPAAIGPVLVLRADRGARGVSQVWINVASADSAARAIAAAGDSVARKSALDELAARRAALDSAFADSVSRDTLRGAAPVVRAPLTRADSLKADSVRRARADSSRPRVPTVPPPTSRSGPPPLREDR